MNLLLLREGPKVVYIAGPFRGSDSYAEYKNIRVAEALSWRLWKKLSAWRPGCAVLCPHLNTAHFQSSLPDNVWLEGDLTMLARCDAVVLTRGWKRSAGAGIEAQKAHILGIPVLLECEVDGWMKKCDAAT
jgi:hypothetical protein